MKIIEKIEIKNFRSFGNRKKSKTQIIKINNLNIFSGANDSGKSNILRSLNLFFNGQTEPENFLNFKNDFFKKDRDNDDIKEEMITIKISFINSKNKGKNEKSVNKTYLPEKFWVAKKFLKDSKFSSYNQDDGVEISFIKEKGVPKGDKRFYEKKNGKKKLKQEIRASLSKQLSEFLNSIYFHYIPAIKDKNYFSFLYGELQKTLLKEKNSNVDNSKKEFQKSLQESTQELMDEFKDVANNESINISPAFELPNLIDLFKSLKVQTKKDNNDTIELKYRGDGIQAKLIPEILNFIAKKELSIKQSSLKKGEKLKKYFIWGFEEPENSYEYANAQKLADKIKDIFIENAQIFLTTHSFNFLSLEANNISTYRVWKDNNISSSRVLKVKNKNGEFIPDESYNEDTFDLLNKELGFLKLSNELEKQYKKIENERKELKDKIKKIEKPVIYTEGNNVDYINKAKGFFAENLDFDVESLGGAGDMSVFFEKLQKTNFKKNKAIFVFDCDATEIFNKCIKNKTNYLIPFILEINKNNTLIKRGIENMFEEELFKDELNELELRFFPKIKIDKGGNGRDIETQEKKLTDGINGSKKRIL